MDSPALNATLPALISESFFNCSGMMEGTIIWCSFSILVVLLGLPVCICVLWDLVDKHYRGGHPFTPNSLFILNITMMDVLFLAFILPEMFNLLLWKNSGLQMFIILVFNLNYSGRPMLMACMCLDCYVAVLHPLRYRSQTLYARAIVITVVWLVVVGNWVALILYPVLNNDFGMNWPFISSLTVIVYCDCCILWALRRTFGTSQGELHPQKKRALHIVGVSLLITLVNYLLPVIAFTFGRLFVQSNKKYNCLIAIPAMIPIALTSIFMPAVHLRVVGKLHCSITPICGDRV